MSIIFGVGFSKLNACIVGCVLAVICAAYVLVRFTKFGEDVPRWGQE